MPESSAATTKPNEIGTGTSGLLQATPGVLVSEPPQPYFQSWFIPGTGCEDIGQHLPCISNGVPQASEKYIVRFDQPVPASRGYQTPLALFPNLDPLDSKWLMDSLLYCHCFE
ncbi:uncharacterized protein AKAW2_50477S [Aspergillus luchuensis]|uniref:Uncharacterized protein n=1 Tax=Aspergillus kawachii TaxID=1069201 RepID=A0A7R7WBY1_ASPKA|nr:uncharacterized protein AKAW2_50477S [Aspergillus luchuensis]KAI3055149.1 hypothetical protein CBS147353_11352 [Aspergillus niger]BCS00136.1 hypothetical protein AKAW2_50477S [Aspergillus luchuensis]